MRSRILSFSMLLTLSLTTCYRTNALYCDRSNPCGNEEYCDAVLHVCEKLGSDTVPNPMMNGGLTIKEISPTRGSPNGDQKITITGTGFQPDSKVFFGSKQLTLEPNPTSTKLVVSYPAGCGARSIEVRNSDNATVKLDNAFRYQYANIIFTNVAKLQILPATFVPARSLVLGKFDGASADGLAAVSIRGAAANALYIQGAGTNVLTVTGTPVPLLSAVHAISANFDPDNDFSDLVLFNEAVNGLLVSVNGNVPFTIADQKTFRARIAVSTDYNGDKTADIVAVDEPLGEVQFFPVAKDGKIGMPEKKLAAKNVISITAVDWDQVGTKELALISADDDLLTVARDTGTAWAADQLPMGRGLKRVFSGDVNGDGKTDMLVVTDTGLRIVLNATVPGGALNYKADIQPVALPMGTNPNLLELADLNCDALPELITYQAGLNELRIYPNNSGTLPGIFDLLSSTKISLNEPIESLVVASLGSDKPSLLMLNAAGDNLLRSSNGSN